MLNPLSEIYQNYCRPELAKLLRVIRLDCSFHRGEGDFLYYFDKNGEEKQVLDLVGGYGASLFGHNHPELVKVAQEFFNNKGVFNAQGSCRKNAGLVAEKLDKFLCQATGQNFITTFASTGAEAIEAAMKHAELAQMKKFEELKKQVEIDSIKIKAAFKKGLLSIPGQFFKDSLRLVGVDKTAGIDRILQAVYEFNRVAFLSPPYFAALEKSFHGKTSGAVKLTYNKDYRLPFSRIGPNIIFIKPDDPKELIDLADKCELTWLFPEIKNGELILSEKTLLNLSAFFVEPLQGEGGINVLGSDSAARIRDFTRTHNVPLIIDEIQSGMGRTGTFLFSQQIGLIGDYYVFSKSLGGGIAKISALCVEKSRYEKEFSLLHTSTFAEDDFSSTVALRALELLENGGKIFQDCHARGQLLLGGLRRIQGLYPEVIRDVRGCGLMLGIEFFDLSECPAYAIRALAAGKMLGFAIAGYFLHEHGIRVAPAVSSNLVMRIEPSALIAEEQIQRFFTALERLCLIIKRHNSCQLLKYIAEEPPSGLTGEIADYSQPARRVSGSYTKVAVIGHFVESRQISLWDKSFSEISDAAKKVFVNRVYEAIPPFVCDPWLIQSKNGETIEFSVIALVIDSDLFYRNMIRRLEMFREKIESAVDLAIEKGFSTVCLGGYTSMITRNGETIETDRIVVTTGNSLTVGMGLEAVFQTAVQNDIQIENCVTAVVGAAGNIGSAYCEILAERVGQLILIGHRGRDENLKKAACAIYAGLIEILNRKDESTSCPVGQIFQTVARSRTCRNFLEGLIKTESLLDEFDSEFPDQPPIMVATDIFCLKKAQIILTATNSSEPVIYPEMLGDEPVIINDVSVPIDTHPSVLAKENVVMIRGGIVKLPMNADLKIEGLELEPGVLFACMTEAVLLGLEKTGIHFSYGKVDRRQVNQIMEIAHRHGFDLSRSKIESWF
ncbi:MAG: aminotransferase class III-fold pyridoxal phosphate-dependent enzyme [Candidatus Rifleibacteriota bacterium]